MLTSVAALAEPAVFQLSVQGAVITRSNLALQTTDGTSLMIPAPDPGAKDLRAMYAKLAREYDSRPKVPDLGGGLPGQLVDR